MTTFTIPRLETDRLILRAPDLRDFDAYAGFLASQRATDDSDPLTRHTAWLGFAADIGHWHLRGYGFWAVEEKTSGKTVGMVGFFHPEGWPGPELGWTLFDGFEGRGFAIEAARCAREHAYKDLGWGSLISVIAPDNARSIALAEKLGAILEREWTSPTGDAALIYRHQSMTGDST